MKFNTKLKEIRELTQMLEAGMITLGEFEHKVTSLIETLKNSQNESEKNWDESVKRRREEDLINDVDDYEELDF